ncbi:outer membrane protein assembly factor BamB family protein [Streptomyces barringtoniae]|uniref:outer membrane protein assembly factor BamB family protein n=1 Tax=Streptomyces barringtoniae TaxID=2892029 RepID=UPI001E467153|nr:PQQ-binding-like beta-propeller repeat protein [Streptomyces barringtoniae]MCC5478616.1 PQQ-like beta-propeller repeat protein [Streptomyces barringtoniae]
MSFGPPPSMYTQSAPTADQPRNRPRRRVLGAVAAVVAAVVCLGAGLFWYHSADRTKGRTDAKAVRQAPDAIRETVEKAPVSPEGQVVVQHNEGGLTGKQQRFAPATWATDTIVARTLADRIEGYKIEPDPDWDAKAWTLQLGGHVCAVSRDVTADGRTAVVVEPGRTDNPQAGVCDEVVMVDLGTGKKLWQEKMPAADAASIITTNISLTRGVVAIAWGEGSVAYDMDSGKRLWKTLGTSQCRDSAYAGGGALLALVKCGDSSAPTYRVEKLEPRTGKVLWRYSVSNGLLNIYLPSADPPVIAVEAGDYRVTDLITLDPKNGERLATISMNGYAPTCGGNVEGFFDAVDKCYGMVVGRDRVFVMSKDTVDLTRKPENQITAFDLKTGTAVKRFVGRRFQQVVPVRMNGDDLIIFRSTDDDVQPATVLDWNLRTDKETPYLLFHLPADDEAELGNPEDSDILYEQGRAFFARRVLARDDVHPKDPVLSVIGVGTAGLKH